MTTSHTYLLLAAFLVVSMLAAVPTSGDGGSDADPWIRNDLAAALKEAQAKNKPVFALFR